MIKEHAQAIHKKQEPQAIKTLLSYLHTIVIVNNVSNPVKKKTVQFIKTLENCKFSTNRHLSKSDCTNHIHSTVCTPDQKMSAVIVIFHAFSHCSSQCLLVILQSMAKV